VPLTFAGTQPAIPSVHQGMRTPSGSDVCWPTVC
jgi:hypothetical protein